MKLAPGNWPLGIGPWSVSKYGLFDDFIWMFHCTFCFQCAPTWPSRHSPVRWPVTFHIAVWVCDVALNLILKSLCYRSICGWFWTHASSHCPWGSGSGRSRSPYLITTGVSVKKGKISVKHFALWNFRAEICCVFWWIKGTIIVTINRHYDNL